MKECTGADQVAEAFLLDQASDGNDRRRRTGKIGRSKSRQVDSVVDAMNLRVALRETLLEQADRIIAHGDDTRRSLDQFREGHGKIAWRENVVGMRGESEWRREKF